MSACSSPWASVPPDQGSLHGSSAEAMPRAAPPAEPPTSASRLLSRQFLQVVALQFTFGLGFSVFFLYPKYMAEVLRAGPTAIGQANAAGPLLAALAVPCTAAWLDRRGRRGPIVAGTLTLAAASFGQLLIDHFGIGLLLLRGLQGMSFTLVFSAAGTLAADGAPKARLSQAIGLFSVSMIATNAIAPAIAEPLAARYGYELVFSLAGGCALLSTLLALGLVDAPSVRSTSRFGFGHLRGRHTLAVLYAAGALGVAFAAFATFSQPMVLAMGAQQVRGLFIGYTATAVAARLLLGTLADSLGRYRVSLVALTLYGVVVLGMATLRPSTLLLFGAGVGLAHGLVYPALTAVLLERIGSAGRGSAMAFFVGTFNAGGAVSCLGLGVMASAWGYPVVFLTAGCVALSAVVGLAVFTGGDAALHAQAPLEDNVLR